MRIARSPLALVALALLVLVLGALPAPVRAGENPLDPSPHRTPADAIRHARERTAEASPPEAADVVGAVTRLRGGRLGFMPVLQHHMAVEHWFLEGLDQDAIRDAFAGTSRCYVRLRGQVTLLGIFGGSGLEWYGTGLAHGREWGPVMGYHERVYGFRVDEVVWAMDRTTYLAHRRQMQAAEERVQALLRELRYTEARQAIAEAIEGHRDAGLDVRDLSILEQHATMMTTLLAAPPSWSEADEEAVVQALLGKPTRPFRELRDGATERLLTHVRAWPDAVHDRLAPRVVEGWLQVPYRHVREDLRPVVEAFRSDAVAAWKARVAEAETRVEAAKEKLAALQGTSEYAAMLAVLEEAAPYQAVVLDYALGEGRTKHWVPAARWLAELTEAWDDAARRKEVLMRQLRETIASKSGLPNSRVKPRYNEEITLRFAPRLSAHERRDVETELLEIAESLTPGKDWQETLLTAELLAAFGGKRAKSYLRSLLSRTRNAPKWQREHLQAFADALADRR